MAVFSTNQNRQLYVVKTYTANVSESSDAGTLGGIKVIDGPQGKELYFLYKGADTLLKSDRIQLKNLDYGKAVNASEMVTPLKSVEVSLDSNVNGGSLVSGQDYVLRIAFRQFYGMSDEDQYFKDVAIHATSSMSTSDFYNALVKALNLAFSREVGATATSNPYLTFDVKKKGGDGADKNNATALVITEKAQEWTLGIQSQERVYFDVYPTTVYVGGDDVIWGEVTDAPPAKSAAVVGTNALGNGSKIADLEYFCMGERGDQYRMQGWPNYIPTTYLADATTQYHVLELHHAFTDSGVNSYRSEKDITIAVPIGTGTAGKTTMNNIISAINTAVGNTVIKTLS